MTFDTSGTRPLPSSQSTTIVDEYASTLTTTDDDEPSNQTNNNDEMDNTLQSSYFDVKTSSISLEDELDYRLQHLIRQQDSKSSLRREREMSESSVGGEFDILEEGEGGMFGEDYGWECGIWWAFPSSSYFLPFLTWLNLCNFQYGATERSLSNKLRTPVLQRRTNDSQSQSLLKQFQQSLD